MKKTELDLTHAGEILALIPNFIKDVDFLYEKLQGVLVDD